MQVLSPVIRLAKISDLDALVGLLKELFTIEEDFAFDEVRQIKGLTRLLQNPERCYVLVAQHRDRVIGMCTMQILISTAEGGNVGLIEDMVVSSSFRGKGLGKILLSTMQKIAREQGLSRLQLLADHQNQPALDFYRKMGWSETQLFCLRMKLPA